QSATGHKRKNINPLFSVFPDAKIIQTHRDPVKVLPSFCSMIAHSWGIFSDKVDPMEIGKIWSAKQEQMVNRSMDYRTRAGDNNFIDISYYDLISNPIREIKKTYEFLKRPLTSDALNRMTAWMDNNPQHKHGRHKYSLHDFGLTKNDVEDKFGKYRKRFKIRTEEHIENQ
ncbi:sulfotransferase, partial [Spirochaetota bacterium]